MSLLLPLQLFQVSNFEFNIQISHADPDTDLDLKKYELYLYSYSRLSSKLHSKIEDKNSEGGRESMDNLDGDGGWRYC